uniref:Si:ch211-241f5.3 n=1 Tax=Neogobius melanostomus TaxID=47308 RepID=A0A8C6TIQ3_9GOBI
MGRTCSLLILVLLLILTGAQGCENGFLQLSKTECVDKDECEDKPCGPHAKCFNTVGSYYCQCEDGFRSTKTVNFTVEFYATCLDINECLEDKNICGPNATCINSIPDYTCKCKNGFASSNGTTEFKKGVNVSCSGKSAITQSTFDEIMKYILIVSSCTDIDECLEDDICGKKAICKNSEGSHSCVCDKGFVLSGNPTRCEDFAAVSLLSYSNLEESAGGFFDGLKKPDNKTLKINSKIVTVTVSNTDTSFLKEPVLITFNHLQQLNQTSHCVFWDSSLNGGVWSSRGCTVKESNLKNTVCSCNHLSSFAVLMALYEVEDRFELQLITWVGLSLSLVCLFICILTFGLIRSIQSQRTKIHLHLSISLFLAYFIFLIGISRTENKVGCAVVAGLLHFFFLASFCWMCLEGIQLFRMVVLVFNSSFRRLYMMAAGYGVPAVIVSISALANAKGYGTERYCWLSLDSIWSFFGPACVIIFVNIIFFLITVWKLAQKFSSLNPDLNNLQKIKTFTITAVAQLCVLGTMWIFGCFQFEEKTIAMTYLFTIFASLQGVLLFIMHCLCSKQVRDEYKNILSKCCAPQKKPYSEFGYTQSSKAQVRT